tara:strand:- start:137 stop:1573 length:1437 start_codon:yes stop_codon:yes gene_type:complete
MSTVSINTEGGPSPRRGSLTKRMSNGFVEIKETGKEVVAAVRPSLTMRRSSVGVDVLGMSQPANVLVGVVTPRSVPAPPAPLESQELLTPRSVAGETTSDVLSEEQIDWAAEALLLTHEPLRRDMAAMNECLEVRFFGALPESWRVRTFFRFFSGWSSLLAQHNAVEASVHCDYLAAPTGQLPSSYRQNLLDFQRDVDKQVTAVGRMEAKILEELTLAADWTTIDPKSECAEELRVLLDDLSVAILEHLKEQEEMLPPLLRSHWGPMAPPDLVTRSITAAKSAAGNGLRPQIHVKLFSWVLYYLRERDETRSKFVVAQLSFTRRLRIALRLETSHSELLEQLRAIIRDEEPRWRKVSAVRPSTRQTISGVPKLSLARASEHNNAEPGFEAPFSARGREAQRRQTGVHAVLAAANATRASMAVGPDASVDLTYQLAQLEKPLYQYGNDGPGDAWWKHAKYQSNMWKHVSNEKPSTPRRI